jgi:predicted ester cyclase
VLVEKLAHAVEHEQRRAGEPFGAAGGLDDVHGAIVFRRFVRVRQVAQIEHVEHDAVVELIRREPRDYDAIRELWKKHSIAEDERDLPGLISTLTEDCVYELAQSGHRWEGHEGAARFYTGLLTAFPDIHFDLTDIVIGPQGVCEEARVTGTHEARWLDSEPSGKKLAWRVLIFFPWDEERKLFRGEKVYTDVDVWSQAAMR